MGHVPWPSVRGVLGSPTSGEKATASLGLARLTAVEAPQLPVALAAAVIVTAPAVVAFLLAQRALFDRVWWSGEGRAVLALLVPALLAAGCGGGDGESPRASITIRVSGEPDETAVYDLLLEAFEREHPGIDGQAVPVAKQSDHIAKLVTSFAGGNPPDVFLLNFREYSQFVTRDAVLPLGDRRAGAGVEVADYHQPSIDAFTFDGDLQCMPQNISSLVVYWNRAVFRAAGVAQPEPGWSWDDFRRTAAALTNGDVRGLGVEPSLIRLVPFVWSAGGHVVDDEANPTRLTLDQPGSRKALAFLLALVRDGLVPTAEEVAAQDLESRFIAGKLGMLLESRRVTPGFREVRTLDWDVAPLPIDAQPATVLHADGFCIARKSRHLDAALEFVAFATGPEGQGISALNGRTVPSQDRADGAFLDPTSPPEHARVFLDTIPTIRRTPVLPTWTEIEDKAGVVLERAFADPAYQVDEVARDLDESTRELFEEAEGR